MRRSLLGAAAAAILSGACGAVAPALIPAPPSVPAVGTASPAPAPTGSLSARLLGGGVVAPGQRLGPDAQLVFDVSGSAGSYLYLLEQGPDALTVLHPRSGWINPANGRAREIVPQPTWTTDQDDLLPGWTPLSSGPLEYLLVAAPTPRGGPSDQRLDGGLEQLLAPPPYVSGPAGGRAVVVARLAVTRDEPPDEPDGGLKGEPEDEPEPPDEPELRDEQ